MVKNLSTVTSWGSTPTNPLLNTPLAVSVSAAAAAVTLRFERGHIELQTTGARARLSDGK